MGTGQPDERPDAPEDFPESASPQPLSKAGLRVRAARPEDAEVIATILAEAFPGMYRATFGTAGSEEAAWLLTELFQAGVLSLEASRVCERGERVIGVALLSVGEPLARGSARAYWRLLRRQLGLPRAPRAFFGGLAVLFFTERRIPKAEELVYIKALAVVETERGRGVGTCLLQDTARWTLEQGRAWLGLHVLDSNVRARRLYERMGFHPWRAASSRSLAARLLARYRPDWSGSLMIRAVQEAMQGGPSATLG